MMKREGILFCLVGPAGSGKTTFGARLLKEWADSMKLSISATSRAPRAGEEEGKSYFFLSREAFEAKIKADEFFEWEETHGNYYGTLRSVVDGALSSGMDLLLDVDIRGALNFKKHFPFNTCIIFIIPPSATALIERIRGRSAISDHELETRLKTARGEYQILLEIARHERAVDYLLLNDELESSYRKLNSFIESERSRLRRLDLESLKALCHLP